MKNSNYFSIKILSFLLLLCIINGCGEQTGKITDETVSEPKNMIVSLEDGKVFYDTYTQRRAKIIKRYEDSMDKRDQKGDTDGNNQELEESTSASMEGGFVPTRFIEFDYKDLKTYLKFIEQEADSAQVDISNLRIYLTNYPNEQEFPDGKTIKEPRRNSVMMVPTTSDGKKDFAFYTADDSEDGQRKAYLLTDELDDTGKYTGGKKKSEASIAPSILPVEAPAPPAQNQQSLYGNEGGLRPPS